MVQPRKPKTAERTAQSRLSDDLYRLYLVAMGWLLFPVYGEFFALALPTSPAALEWVFPIAVIGAQLGWLWSGARGGPMMVLQGSIIHELLAPVSARRTLAPQLLRQALAWGTAGAVLGGLLTSLAGEFTFTRASQVSIAGFLLALGATFWGANLMVGVRSTGPLQALLVGASAAAAVTATVASLVLDRVGNGASLGVLAFVATVGASLSYKSLDNVPVHSLWHRARRLESARSALLAVDLHRMLIDLRRAGESTAVGNSRPPTGHWLSAWRAIAPLRHGTPWSAIRIGAATTAALLLAIFDTLDEGIALAAFGLMWLVVGYELTRGLAALADHVGFVVHFPKGSFQLLIGQLAASVAFASVLIVAINGWLFFVDSQTGAGAVILAVMGILAGAVQARLGSPPTATFMQNYGVSNAAALLWMRAAAAPIIIAVTVLLAFHGYLQPDLIEPPALIPIDISAFARSAVFAVGIGAAVTAVVPLERALR